MSTDDTLKEEFHKILCSYYNGLDGIQVVLLSLAFNSVYVNSFESFAPHPTTSTTDYNTMCVIPDEYYVHQAYYSWIVFLIVFLGTYLIKFLVRYAFRWYERKYLLRTPKSVENSERWHRLVMVYLTSWRGIRWLLIGLSFNALYYTSADYFQPRESDPCAMPISILKDRILFSIWIFLFTTIGIGILQYITEKIINKYMKWAATQRELGVDEF